MDSAPLAHITRHHQINIAGMDRSGEINSSGDTCPVNFIGAEDTPRDVSAMVAAARDDIFVIDVGMAEIPCPVDLYFNPDLHLGRFRWFGTQADQEHVEAVCRQAGHK